jgi:hypothetical protein
MIGGGGDLLKKESGMVYISAVVRLRDARDGRSGLRMISGYAT